MDPILVRLVAVALFALAVVVAGRAWRSRDGRLAVPAGPARLTPEEVPRSGVVGVLLTSPTCSTCEAAKDVLAEVAAARPRFSWRAADASDHLDLVRALGVLRAPTLLLVAPDGHLIARSSGVPRPDELRRSIDATVPHTARRRAPLRGTARPGVRGPEAPRPVGS